MPMPDLSALKDDVGTLPLSDDYLPAVMQAIHYFTEMMQYEQVQNPATATSTLRPKTTTKRPTQTTKRTTQTMKRPTTTTQRTTVRTTTTRAPATTQKTTTRKSTTSRTTRRTTPSSQDFPYLTEIDILCEFQLDI